MVKPLPRQSAEIILPIGVPISSELEEVIPAVDTGRVHVVENEPRRVIADWNDFDNRDVLLARDGLALVGRMALHLRPRALDAQIFRAEIERLRIVER